MTTRAEHLQWCKERALEYVDAGDVRQAFTSLASDLNKHPDTQNALSVVTVLGMPLLVAGQLDSPAEMRRWIEGLN